MLIRALVRFNPDAEKEVMFFHSLSDDMYNVMQQVSAYLETVQHTYSRLEILDIDEAAQLEIAPGLYKIQ